MNITKSQLAGLSKTQLNDLIGASFHPEIEAFCNQCSTKTLAAWILSVCVNGSFLEGMKALSCSCPTQVKVRHSKVPYTFYDRAGSAIDHFKVEAYSYECPSLWAVWFEIIKEQLI